MALALALCAGAAWAPVLTRAPTRRGAGPMMLGNFPGGNDGGGGFKLPDFGSMFGGADGPREEIDAAYEQPEPSAEVLASFEMDEVELAEQSAKLDALAAKWKRRRIAMEDEKAIQLGWKSKIAEKANGRSAMFFIIVGLVTEYYTGQSLPEQVYTLFQTIGVVE